MAEHTDVPGRDYPGHCRWDDDKFPATGNRLDSSATRYRFNHTELTIEFDANARYDTEVLGFINQMRHAWFEGSHIHPHIHWYQDQVAIPNWLLQYRIYNNGETPPSWNNLVLEDHVFTYTSGRILQISTFPIIDMTGIRISGFAEFKLSRDTANGSGEFSGVDPVVAIAHYKEFDTHVLFDDSGSKEVFTKDGTL